MFLVWSATVRIRLSTLCQSKLYIFCICRLSGMWTVQLSSVPGDMVSVDRGFHTDEIVGLMHAEVRIPLFTKGYSQVHAQDVESIRELAIFTWRGWLGLCMPSRLHNLNRNPTDLFGASLWRWRDHIPGKKCVCCTLTNMCPNPSVV